MSWKELQKGYLHKAWGGWCNDHGGVAAVGGGCFRRVGGGAVVAGCLVADEVRGGGRQWEDLGRELGRHINGEVELISPKHMILRTEGGGGSGQGKDLQTSSPHKVLGCGAVFIEELQQLWWSE